MSPDETRQVRNRFAPISPKQSVKSATPSKKNTSQKPSSHWLSMASNNSINTDILAQKPK